MLMASEGILELAPKLTLNAATGSTLTYEWSYTEDAATDATRLYNIELFRDEACSELHVSWLADGKLASDKGIFTALAGYPDERINVTGLDPGTTYYFRVKRCPSEGVADDAGKIDSKWTELCPVTTQAEPE